MKIDFIYDCVYPFSKGGAEKRVASYADALASIDHDVSIVSMKWWDDVVNNGKIKNIACCRKLRLYKKDGNRSVVISFLFGVSVFWFVLRRRGVDVYDIEIFPYFPIIFARAAILFTRKKSLIIGYWSEYLGKEYWKKHFGLLWFFGVLLEYLSFVSCDRIIANSHFTQKKLRNAFPRKDMIIDLLPPASIDRDVINAVIVHEKMYDIIYYGRIIWHKHVEHVVHAVDVLVHAGYDARALIIGDGPDAEKIADMIVSKGLQKNIERCDFVDVYVDLVAKIKMARVMIQPSEREGFGITVAEANACGLPVFVVDYPDNAAKELIKDGTNGFVCNDPNDLMMRVMAFFLDEHMSEHLVRLSHGSVELSRKYTSTEIQKLVIETYKKM